MEVYILSKWNEVRFEDLLSNFFARKPKEVDGLANTSAMYYRDWMIKKLLGRFEISGIPDNWDYDYFMTALFVDGLFTITDTEMGVLPLQCGVTGVNVFNHPTEVNVANPVLGSFRRVIDEDCVVVKLQYNYKGVNTMLDRYAALLAMCDSSISVNLMNSKVTFIGLASSKAQAETMKKMYDDISMGKPAIFLRGDQVNGENFFFNNVKNSFIADDIQLVKRKLVNEFLTEIGINNANLDKRERLVESEVEANNSEILCNVQHWLDNIREGFDKANEMFGLSLSVKLREFEEVTSNESAKSSGLLPGNEIT